MDGWIKLHRRIAENPLWRCEQFSRGQAWVDLLLLANFNKSFFYKRGVKIDVNRGQVARSEVELSDRWRWSRTKVRSFLNDLEKEQQIIQHKNNVCLLVTIVNYDLYQQEEQQNRQQKNSRKTAKEQQKNTLEEREEEREEKEEKEIEEAHTPSKFDIFNDWLKENYPNVASMKTQMTEQNLKNLIDTYGKDVVTDHLMQMENKIDIAIKYKSVYLTLLTWIKRGLKK